MWKTRSIFIVFFLMMISYLHGGLTIKYRIFPYDHLENLKNFIVARTNLTKPSYFPRSDFYEDRLSFFERHRRKYDVVMIGDSLTERADWEDLFPKLRIANRGIGGDTTDGVLDRIDNICATEAKKAFIMVGINDFSRGYSVELALENYIEIIKRLRACGVKPYVQSTVLASKNKKSLNIKAAELNRLLEEATIENGVEFIDVNSGLTEGELLNDKFTRDGLHLNGDGYGAWRDILQPYID
jgi:lysophospholipase L1-like esterase